MKSERLQASVTSEEIRATLFSLNANKAPSPDGYTTAFFREAWPIVGESVTPAIMQFFSIGRMDRQVNSTILTLIPKKNNATHMQDYRPISCCSTIYKCIAKLLANNLKEALLEVSSLNLFEVATSRITFFSLMSLCTTIIEQE